MDQIQIFSVLQTIYSFRVFSTQMGTSNYIWYLGFS